VAKSSPSLGRDGGQGGHDADEAPALLLPNTIKTLEFVKEKFMAQELTSDFPVEGGVKFQSGEGRAPKDGGSYRPLGNQLSLQEFEQKFQALHNFENRRATVLNSYLASASKKDRAGAQVEAQLTKDQSAYLLHDPVYIEEHGGTGAGTGTGYGLSRIGGLGSRKQSDALPSIVSSSRNVFEQLLIPADPIYKTLEIAAHGGALKLQSPSSNGLFAHNMGSNQSAASVGQALD